MTQHRYPCPAKPPKLLLPDTPAAASPGNHRHACIHDATPNPQWALIEHQCECGMTWTSRDDPASAIPDEIWMTSASIKAREKRPAPDWVTFENADGDWRTFRRFTLPIFAAVMIPLLVIGAVATWLVTR